MKSYSRIFLKVKEAFRIITEDDKVKAILVNVFGGIVNCATIANGIVNACKSIDLKVRCLSETFVEAVQGLKMKIEVLKMWHGER